MRNSVRRYHSWVKVVVLELALSMLMQGARKVLESSQPAGCIACHCHDGDFDVSDEHLMYQLLNNTANSLPCLSSTDAATTTIPSEWMPGETDWQKLDKSATNIVDMIEQAKILMVFPFLLIDVTPVSYTHLTLPTICSV